MVVSVIALLCFLHVIPFIIFYVINVCVAILFLEFRYPGPMLLDFVAQTATPLSDTYLEERPSPDNTVPGVSRSCSLIGHLCLAVCQEDVSCMYFTFYITIYLTHTSYSECLRELLFMLLLPYFTSSIFACILICSFFADYFMSVVPSTMPAAEASYTAVRTLGLTPSVDRPGNSSSEPNRQCRPARASRRLYIIVSLIFQLTFFLLICKHIFQAFVA